MIRVIQAKFSENTDGFTDGECAKLKFNRARKAGNMPGTRKPGKKRVIPLPGSCGMLAKLRLISSKKGWRPPIINQLRKGKNEYSI